MLTEDHACLAICSTLLMQERLQSLREEWNFTVYSDYEKMDKPVPDFQVRCGLHTDVSFVGNMGSPARMKYGVAGSTYDWCDEVGRIDGISDLTCIVSQAARLPPAC